MSLSPHPPLPAFDGATPLPGWRLMRAFGPDAASFLHGQLTQDVAGMAAGQARLAGYCSAKGRLLATFVVWRSAPEEFFLACSADLFEPTLKRLRMFVLRAKCKLEDASPEWALHGAIGPGVAAWLGQPLPVRAALCQPQRQVVSLGGGRYLCALPLGQALPLDELPAGAWEWAEVHSAEPRVVAATVEHFVPQMVNLELVGGVSFNKGCYPGQEVVARSQYRGTVKRRAQLFLAHEPLQPGQEVFSSQDASQPAGEVVLAASLPGAGHAALVEVKLEALAEGQLLAGSATGLALQPVALPYALPAA